MADPIFFTDQEKANEYEWAEHLIWMEGGEIVEAPIPKPVWPGVTVGTGVAALAYALGSWLGGLGWQHARLVDPVLIAMILGLALGNVRVSSRLLPGLNFSVRTLLPFGIVLLGARINFVDALKIGLPGLALSALVVVMSIGLVYGLRKWLGLERVFACLLAVGTGICGGTAIVAVAPILKARERDVMLGVALVTLVGLVSMIVLPIIAGPLCLTQTQFGLLAGLTIHQTPQVIASGFAFGDEAGEVATVAKLARVCLLAPVAVILGVLASRMAPDGVASDRRPWYQLLPWFAVGFLILAAVRSFGLLPETTWEWANLFQRGPAAVNLDFALVCKKASGFLLAMGMVGVGFQTRFSHFKNIGIRPLLAASGASLVIGVVVLFLVKFLFP